MKGSERWFIGVLLLIALAMFFFPLATLQVPLLGNQDVSGYDLFSKAKAFSQALDHERANAGSESGAGPQQPESSPESESSPEPADGVAHDNSALRFSMPLSIQILPALPICILVSFALAFLGLFGCLVGLGSGFLRLTATLGAVLAAFAVVHLIVLNSDLHTFLQQQMLANSTSGDSLAGLGQQIGNLAINAVQLKPGAGLYALAVALTLATILLRFFPDPSFEFANDGDDMPRRREFLGFDPAPVTPANTQIPLQLQQNYGSGCTQCGQFLRPTDRFCPGCGVAQ